VKHHHSLVLFAVAWLLSSCAAPSSAAPSLTPAVVPTQVPTIAATPASPTLTWGGDHAPVQMDLTGTITGSPKPFGQVRGVALDKDGNLYAVDGATSQVMKFDPAGKLLMQWGEIGTADGQFVMSGLQGQDTTGFVALDSQGNVYVTENNRVQKFDSNGKFLTKWGEAGSGDGQFGLALAIAVDPQDNLYVVDINNNEIQKFDSSGKFLLKWGGKGSGDGQFSNPTSVAIDMQGNVLVSDADTGRLQKFDSNGKFLSQVYLGAVDGMVIGPVAMAVGDQGQIYIGEFAHGRVVEFDSSGKLLAAWGNTGSYQDQMSEAGGMALGKDGGVYVGDAFNHRVLIFRPH
jgi:tripartite motif-containing protein 71